LRLEIGNFEFGFLRKIVDVAAVVVVVGGGVVVNDFVRVKATNHKLSF